VNRRHDEFGAIRDIVYRETIFAKTYEGQVINNVDPKQLGRIQVTIPELWWADPLSCPFVMPEIGYSEMVPRVGQYVLVYFVGGSANYPVYRGRSGYVKPNHREYPMLPTKDILFKDDDPATPLTLTYDQTTYTLEFKIGATTTGKLDGTNNALEFKLGATVEVKVDGTSNTLEVSLGSMKLKTDGSQWEIDASGNKIVHTAMDTTISTNLKVTK